MLGFCIYLSVLKNESELTAKKSEIPTLESDLDTLESENHGEKKASDAMIDDIKNQQLERETYLQENIGEKSEIAGDLDVKSNELSFDFNS